MTLNTEILADSPTHYYRLNETSGTTLADSSGNSNDATISGSPTLGVAGIDGSSSDAAISFTPDDYASMPVSTFTGEFSLEFLINGASLTELNAPEGASKGAIFRRRVFTSFWETTNEIILHTDRIELRLGNSTLPHLILATPLENGTTYHVVVRRVSGGDVTVWINGVNVGTGNTTATVEIEDIGGNGTGNQLEGVVDEVALYNTALSDARIVAHYEAAELLKTISFGIEITVEAETSIIQFGLKQTVYENGSISIGLEQTVTHNTSTISIALEQSVYEAGSLSITLSQNIYDTAATPTPSWSLAISVGGIDLSGVLTGTVEISASEQEAKLAQFTIKPALGPIDVYSWVNKQVEIDYTNGQATRIYTGVVDRPVYDPNTGLTTFYCTDGMQNTFNNLNQAQIDELLGGYHSPYIFGEDSRGWDYAKEQLSTLPKSFDLDANGVGRLTDWEAKATPDFSFGESNILHNSLRVELAKRDKVHNTHNITFQFRFQRLRERERDFIWLYPEHFTAWVVQPTTLPTKTMIRDAVENTGWTMAAESYTNPPPSHIVRVGVGNDIYWNIREDVRAELAFSASFSIKRRWVQTVQEEYEINVFANQSVEKLGELKQASQFSVSSSEDTEGWEDFTVTPAGVSSVSNNGDSVIDVTSGEVSRADANLAIETIEARAKAQILQSHRQNECRFSTLLNPFIDRTSTVQVTTTPVTTKGKVKSYKHRFDLLRGSALTDCALAISKSQATGVPVDTPIAPPVEADKVDPAPIDPLHVVLDTHIGGRQGSPEYDEDWHGFVGNNALTASKTFNNQSDDPDAPAERDQDFTNVYPGSEVYPTEFNVPAPALETLLTDSIEAQASHVVEVAIPEDTLILAA